MKSKTLILCLGGIVSLAIILITSCERDDPYTTHTLTIESLEGVIQKGPFLNGTSINMAVLNGTLAQTGMNFGMQTTDNCGNFALNNIELSSQYVELKADGFYYNEVSDQSSSARLVLYSVSDLSDKSSVNVNMLSNLEKERIYTLAGEGMAFSEAKDRAQREVLQIFSIEKPDISNSELLDISKEGEDHAILLAVSVILQGHRSVAGLSELLANIASDFSGDGMLDDASLGSELMNHAILLNLPVIRENLESRYADAGMDVTLPDFEKYVNQFIENSGYEVTQQITYPEFSPYGENILFPGKVNFHPERDYSLAADLSTGTQLTVKLSGGLWHYRAMPNGPVNWDISIYDHMNQTQTFTSRNSGEFCDLWVQFSPPTTFTDSSNMQDSIYNDEILMEYFENLSDTPTWSKQIKILEQ